MHFALSLLLVLCYVNVPLSSAHCPLDSNILSGRFVVMCMGDIIV